MNSCSSGRALTSSCMYSGSLIWRVLSIVFVDSFRTSDLLTRTFESTRQIRLPQYIQDLVNALPEDQEFITNYTGQNIYKRFTQLLKRNNIDHMSFHDLRHMNASIMHMLGIPDKYAMERGGWSSDSVLKSVYQHTFSAERQAADDKIDNYFNSLLENISHDNSHEIK